MNPPTTPIGKIRTRFKIALVIVTSSVWLSILSYAKTPESKQSGITLSVFLLVGFLAALGILPRLVVSLRTLVFTNYEWNEEAERKSTAIAFYAMTLLTCYFIWR